MFILFSFVEKRMGEREREEEEEEEGGLFFKKKIFLFSYGFNIEREENWLIMKLPGGFIFFPF